MPKPKPPSYTVVVDSNVLYPKDKTELISPKFTDSWRECVGLAELRLVVPEVVRGERLYQLFSVGEKERRKAESSLKALSKVSGKSGPGILKRVELIEAVEERFEAWVRENGVSLAATPLDRIDWKRVVHDAIWRDAPFVAPTDGKDSEKGFRDCMVLETVREIARLGSGEDLVFISGDDVLRLAVSDQLKEVNLSTYKDVSEFASFLRLIHVAVDEAFVGAILRKVPSVFYTQDDPECVYNKCQIWHTITQRFSLNLDHFMETKPTSFSDLLSAPSSQNLSGGPFLPASDENDYIDATKFEKLTGISVYHWKTQVRFVRLFRQNMPQAIWQGMEWMGEKVRIARFEVSWHATVDDQEMFSGISVDDIVLAEITSEVGLVNKWKYGFGTDPFAAFGA